MAKDRRVQEVEVKLTAVHSVVEWTVAHVPGKLQSFECRSPAETRALETWLVNRPEVSIIVITEVI